MIYLQVNSTSSMEIQSYHLVKLMYLIHLSIIKDLKLLSNCNHMLRSIMGNTKHGLNAHQLLGTLIRALHEVSQFSYNTHSYYYSSHITDGRCESLRSKISCPTFLMVELLMKI